MGRSKAPVVETSTVAQPSTTQHVAPADKEGQGESDRHRSNRERLVDLETQLNRLDEKVTKVAAHEERVTMLEVTLAQLIEQVAELQDNTKEVVHHLKEQTIELFARGTGDCGPVHQNRIKLLPMDHRSSAGCHSSRGFGSEKRCPRGWRRQTHREDQSEL
ncbi:hypothetical protein ACMD2_15038 [Ananas comosus]|uniref:Uncharacterized protein n=1 Tax=Ananas comosus TaxID=4615 RepID=A0A199W370_ANACO|nr:hypothetical protein ACMD2_15038 [Ananas comosus]